MTQSDSSSGSAPNSATALGKGQLRCCDCRVPALIKDGRWRDRAGQQVFVCKICENREKARANASAKTSGEQ